MSSDIVLSRLPIEYKLHQVLKTAQGSDHSIYVILVNNKHKVVRTSSPTTFTPLPLHEPTTVFALMTYIHDYIDSSAHKYFPIPLYLHNELEPHFLIESFIEGINLSAHDEPFLLLKSSTFVIEGLAHSLAALHSIKTEGYGPLCNTIPRGLYENWTDHFISFPPRLEKCFNMSTDMKANCLKIYNDIHPVLQHFTHPSLVHGDVCGSNIRIQHDSSTNEWKFSGLIDFGDAMSGDYLYDFGRLLSHIYGDWKILTTLYESYISYRNTSNDHIQSSLSPSQIQRIQFYAISFSVWMWSMRNENDHIVKYETILKNLLNNNNE
jgi:aminoglycoside phosphotransferase (APT) family kinase protein